MKLVIVKLFYGKMISLKLSNFLLSALFRYILRFLIKIGLKLIAVIRVYFKVDFNEKNKIFPKPNRNVFKHKI